ncbi:phytanoyl-CoA dioxygenase [Gibbsiella quercinecans]|uniref:phytanoyl-CoA dioxygenase family protein n=1 Tax=Gibbsiella quercinecans TaxID=929813 RepID=UPI000EF226A9|nr:phytanoyl-CoA dioxygenase family protein [Gibbsiella quercinecans]RLM11221.1 phytanoyl-CoA dioxygenase [Gibbsiella quercinecans]
MTALYFMHEDQISIEDFKAFCDQSVNISEYPLASEAVSDVLIYNRLTLAAAAKRDKKAVLSELHRALSYGPGVFVVRGLYGDEESVDRTSHVFEEIMRAEAKAKIRANRFPQAGAGNSQRILLALQKLAATSPEAFVEYYANPMLNLICQAWLGPTWLMASQVHQVRPGGAVQPPQRDDHLSIQQSAFAAQFPIPVQLLSQYLTLRGVIAHTDVPLACGPMRLLPWSHQYELIYMAYQRADFSEYFAEHYVQVPLNKGDGLFFNPALFHTEGNNATTDRVRTTNLLQVSSAFCVPREEIDHEQILHNIYPLLKNSTLAADALNSVINIAARGYAFPTNFDADPSLGNQGPKNQQALVREALSNAWSLEKFQHNLAENREKRAM